MNAGNRVLWIAIGVLLTAVGVAGVLASLGHLPGVARSDRLADADLAARWHGWGGWATGIAIAVALVVALLGFLLLRAQLRGRGGAAMPDVDLARHRADAGGRAAGRHAQQSEVDTIAGHTHVDSGALRGALTADLQTDQQVRRAAIRLVGGETHPELLVRLAVTGDADLARLHQHVDASLQRFEATSGLHPHLREVTVRIADLQPTRVR